MQAHPSRLAVIVGSTLLACAAAYWALIDRSGNRVADAGFWFENGVTYTSPALDGPLAGAELDAIDQVARAEIIQAFEGLRIRLSDRRDATYSVRVVQNVRDRRFQRQVDVAGESWAVSGFGGRGAVSFTFLAGGAVSYAPAGANRASIVEAIGRGIGRAAVHEFTHQFLPTAAIHDSTDVRSYEYASAARAEQYFDQMRWSLAWPLLHRRFGG